jgi:hypothetical protein
MKIKDYFLFIAPRPVQWSLAEGLIIFLLQAIWACSFWPSEKGINMLLQAVTYLPLYCGFFMTINLIVVKTQIMVFQLNPQEIIIVYDDDDKPLIYRKPFWGRSYYKIIVLPEDWMLALSQYGEVCDISTSLSIQLDDQIILLPFRISFKFNHGVQVKEWENIINMQYVAKDTREYQLDKCIKHIFSIANTEGEQESLLKTIVSDWVYGNLITRNYCLRKMEKIACLPQLFNYAEIEIRLLTLGVRRKYSS